MSSPNAAIHDDAVSQTLADYYAAFSALDVQGVLPYFHEPSLFISLQGVFAAPTFVELTTVFTSAMEDLRTRGFARSELRVADIKSLSATAALVTGVAIRFKRNGQELERAGVTYVLHKAHGGWKIAVIILHDTGPRSQQLPSSTA